MLSVTGWSHDWRPGWSHAGGGTDTMSATEVAQRARSGPLSPSQAVTQPPSALRASPRTARRARLSTPALVLTSVITRWSPRHLAFLPPQARLVKWAILRSTMGLVAR